MTTPERFARKYECQSDGCWRWVGYCTADGYGRFWTGSTMAIAHRWSYEHFVGPIPSGFVIDHLCRNRACVNPAHLEAVTFNENVRRGARARQTHCKHGHEFTPENTYLGCGARQCRTCQRETAARYKNRKSGVTS